jgi:hypothetical protein
MAKAKKFVDLSAEQKQKFNAQLAAFGISQDDVPLTITADGTTRMHKDPELATVKSFAVEVKDLEHLKQLCGVPDAVLAKPGSDAHIMYPHKMPADRAKMLTTGRKQVTEAAMTVEDRETVRSAMTAYMLGNSSKVAPELVQIANAVEFPMTLSVAAAQDLTVTAPYPVSQALVCGTITIEPGGYLLVEADVSIQAQVITVVGS